MTTVMFMILLGRQGQGSVQRNRQIEIYTPATLHPSLEHTNPHTLLDALLDKGYNTGKWYWWLSKVWKKLLLQSLTTFSTHAPRGVLTLASLGLMRDCAWWAAMPCANASRTSAACSRLLISPKASVCCSWMPCRRTKCHSSTHTLEGRACIRARVTQWSMVHDMCIALPSPSVPSSGDRLEGLRYKWPVRNERWISFILSIPLLVAPQHITKDKSQYLDIYSNPSKIHTLHI